MLTEIKGTLVVDYRTKKMRVLKKQVRLKGGEIAIEINIKVNIPTPKRHKIEGEITIPEATAERLVIEAL